MVGAAVNAGLQCMRQLRLFMVAAAAGVERCYDVASQHAGILIWISAPL